jgi:hypothetical protein
MSDMFRRIFATSGRQLSEHTCQVLLKVMLLTCIHNYLNIRTVEYLSSTVCSILLNALENPENGVSFPFHKEKPPIECGFLGR